MGRPVGILANPMSGRDVRRLAARAGSMTPEAKRSQVARAAIGIAAAGCEHVLVVREPFRISVSAVENLRVPARFEVLDVGARLDARDTLRAVEEMRKRDCAAVVAFGGDGTHRAIAKAWPDVPLLPVSTGTNNVFPRMLEATTAGAAAGLLAAGTVALDEVARPAKCVRAEIEGEPDDLALVDAVALVGDTVGNFMPFEPARMRQLVLAIAEPAAVGVSPVGGLVHAVGPEDECGLALECVAPDAGGRSLLVPISPGLYRNVWIGGHRVLALDEPVELRGPCVLAFDGDRERKLREGQQARLRVCRNGPRVIDPGRALALAAERGAFADRDDWRDLLDGAWS